MRHDITLEQLIKAMDTEILIASSFSSKTKRGKRMTFNPSTLKYKIVERDGAVCAIQYTDHPLPAIEMYNDINS